MTDMEIFTWLYELEPENGRQEKKIKKMMSIILKKNELTKIEAFIETLALDEVLDKEVTRVYTYYCNWCKDNNYKPESKIALGKKICETFKVKSTVIKRNGEVFRIYKLDA